MARGYNGALEAQHSRRKALGGRGASTLSVGKVVRLFARRVPHLGRDLTPVCWLPVSTVLTCASILLACAGPTDSAPVAATCRPFTPASAVAPDRLHESEGGFDLLVCTGSSPSDALSVDPETQAPNSQNGEWRRIVDRRNGAVRDFRHPPRRIVSQSLGSDEILLALLPEVRRGDLIAVSALSRSPRYSNVVDQASTVAHTVTDKTEEILALGPDLVLAASYTTPETLRQLENADTPVLVLHQFASVHEIEANIRTLGFALWLDSEGEDLIQRLETQVAQARDIVSELTGPLGGPLRVLAYGAGSVNAEGSTFDDLADRLGLINLPSLDGLRGWPTVGEEQLGVWQPEVVFLSGPRGSEERVADFFRRDFPLLFEGSLPKPRIVVIRGALFGTVSQHLGDLALTMARELEKVMEHQP